MSKEGKEIVEMEKVSDACEGGVTSDECDPQLSNKADLEKNDNIEDLENSKNNTGMISEDSKEIIDSPDQKTEKDVELDKIENQNEGEKKEDGDEKAEKSISETQKKSNDDNDEIESMNCERISIVKLCGKEDTENKRSPREVADDELKEAEQEPDLNEMDEKPETTTKDKELEQKEMEGKYDDKDSCDDTSEISGVTQIDATEIENNTKQIENEEEEGEPQHLKPEETNVDTEKSSEDAIESLQPTMGKEKDNNIERDNEIEPKTVSSAEKLNIGCDSLDDEAKITFTHSPQKEVKVDDKETVKEPENNGKEKIGESRQSILENVERLPSASEEENVNTEKNGGEQAVIEEEKGNAIKYNEENVIEIDDDTDEKEMHVNEEKKDEKQNSSSTSSSNRIESVEASKKLAESSVMVIEIDDDDDEDEKDTDVKRETDKKESQDKEKEEQTFDDTKKINEKKEEKENSNENHDENKEKSKQDSSKQETCTPDNANDLLKEIPDKTASPPPSISADEVEIEDTRDEVFYNKECINYECPKNHKQYFRVPQFAFSHFKVTKKKCKTQYICAQCYDTALDMYEEFCGILMAKQPLVLKDIAGGRQEFVEIIDSSDEEEDNNKVEKPKEPSSFSAKDLELIKKELNGSIKKVLGNVDIQNQLTWSMSVLSARAKRLEEESQLIEDELRSLQKRADNMHVSLYQCPKIKIRQAQPLDLNSGRPYVPTDVDIPHVPPVGEIQRPSIQINENYYAVKNKAIASWVPCKVVERVEGAMGSQKNLKHYKIKFLKSQYQMFKTLSVKHLAYYDPPPVRLPIGTRVIAYFDATTLIRGKEKIAVQSAFYPGIIAEPLKPNNKYRYLIFYDDGYTQYVYHKDVRLVCHVSENVWDDVHPGSRDFIQKYLTQYSINRPMVQAQKGQSMTTESNGKWIYARVVDIDCSLIQMQFEGPKNHTEWIYRGSLRLGPVFKEYQKTLQKDSITITRLQRRTEPFIRYTEDEEVANDRNYSEARAVAKKSVSRQESTFSNIAQPPAPTVPTVRHLNNSTIYLEDENKPKGKVVYYTAKRNFPPKLYKSHVCGPSCPYKITHNLSAYSPLSKPLLSGWERLIIRQKTKKLIAYRGPCGKIMRNMKELHRYLRATANVLDVDNFDFSPETNCLAEYVIESTIVQKRDISGGQEKMAIPLVNYYDNTMPPECKYAAQRIPTEGVDINLDEEFLVGCDCEDDCSDREKCSCWQLTYAGVKYFNPKASIDEIGYQYKRLQEHVPTGIYECNSRCKCKKNCLNRVVQHSLQMKLQVFKTSNRGWGLRCINDIPKGSFICIYAGFLLTEAKANEGGLDAGDEYFAELDYIEVAEQIKEGYESDVEPPEPEEEDVYAPEHDDDEEFTPSKSFLTRSKRKARSQGQSVDEDSQERQVRNFNPEADMNETSGRESSFRKLFGKDEACYVMDAKITGNLGRYFNHSCSPNLFVQNVFVDTHDLRFPWVAFFAQSQIRAGTELTWNYNYEVGVVPGKVLYCQCGAPNCRLRLL